MGMAQQEEPQLQTVLSAARDATVTSGPAPLTTIASSALPEGTVNNLPLQKLTNVQHANKENIWILQELQRPLRARIVQRVDTAMF